MSDNIFGYDSGEDKLWLYTVTNMGDVHHHGGKWLDDKNFILQHSGFREGKPFSDR